MKKTITTTIATLFLTTSLVGPAAANDDLLRLGIGIGAAVLGEAFGGGGNRQAQPRRGDKMEGRVDGKPMRQAPQQTQTAKGNSKKKSEEAEEAKWAALYPIPTVGPVLDGKPTPEEMEAWVAAAPEREAQDAAAEVEMAAGPVVATETTADVTSGQSEEATIEITDEHGNYWGKITPSQSRRQNEFGGLGMGLSDSFRAIGLKGPVEREVAKGKDLIDENGVVWGTVPDEVAGRVSKAIAMGMKPSDAIRVITKLQHPDVVNAKALAEVQSADAVKTECLTLARNGELLHAGIRNFKCGEYREEIAQVEALREIKLKADYLSNGDKSLAACIEKRITPSTKDQNFKECEPFEVEVTYALKKSKEWWDMSPTQRFNKSKGLAEGIQDDLSEAKERRQVAVQLNEEREQLDAALQTTQPPAEASQNTIDEGKTASIDEAPAPAEPVKIKPKKLDL